MNIPNLELTENPNKNNDYIIFRNSIKGKKTKYNETLIKKYKIKKRKTRKTRKGIFNIF